MSCEFCKKIGSHAFGCPNYELHTSKYSCSECDEGIFSGEEYIVNDNGDYAHWECVDYPRDLVKFLGYDVKEMDEDDQEDTNIIDEVNTKYL